MGRIVQQRKLGSHRSQNIIYFIKFWKKIQNKNAILFEFREENLNHLWNPKESPPKKIDVMQICIIQLVDRDTAPFFQMEHFIEGLN